MKPILSVSDKRLKKLYNSHAALCVRPATKEWRFFNVDNIPERWLGWRFVRVIRAARSGLTISESIAKLNIELANYKITLKRKNAEKK